MTTPVTPADLSPTARQAIEAIARALASGFSGELVLECHRGGVRRLRESSSRDFGKGQPLPPEG